MRIQGIQMFRGADGAVVAQVTVKAADSTAAFAEADRALQALTAGKEMELSIAPVRKSRSKDANALLWACLQDIAQALGVDKWGVYLEMLRRYTKGSYIICKPQAVDALQRQWRESEVVGSIEVNGKEAVQLLCYPGSSSLNREEFSKLLDGVLTEMHEMELPLPTPTRIKEVIEAYER